MLKTTLQDRSEDRAGAVRAAERDPHDPHVHHARGAGARRPGARGAHGAGRGRPCRWRGGGISYAFFCNRYGRLCWRAAAYDTRNVCIFPKMLLFSSNSPSFFL